jgi:hypothetical protein
MAGLPSRKLPAGWRGRQEKECLNAVGAAARRMRSDVFTAAKRRRVHHEGTKGTKVPSVKELSLLRDLRAFVVKQNSPGQWAGLHGVEGKQRREVAFAAFA